MTTAAPEAKDNPQTHFQELRRWVAQHLHTGHPVRDASYKMALSAVVHRLIKFGPDETINVMSARDLMNLLIYTNGKIAEWLMRTAFTRAIIENDQIVYEKLASTLFIQEPRMWYWKLVEGLIGQSENPQEVTTWMDQLPPEPKAVARLMAGRLYPDLVHTSWLDDCPNPQISAQFLQLLGTQKKYHTWIEAYLREHPDVRNWTYCLG